MINHNDEHLDGHAQNIVYLFNCNNYSTQHLGETASYFDIGINFHRTAKSRFIDNFYHSKSSCGGCNFPFQILQKFPEINYEQLGYLDDFMSQIWLKHEWAWALKLRLYYPYDLNEKGSWEKSNSNIDEVVIRKIFLPLSRTGMKQFCTRLQRNNDVNSNSCQAFFKKQNEFLKIIRIIYSIWFV